MSNLKQRKMGHRLVGDLRLKAKMCIRDRGGKSLPDAGGGLNIQLFAVDDGAVGRGGQVPLAPAVGREGKGGGGNRGIPQDFPLMLKAQPIAIAQEEIREKGGDLLPAEDKPPALPISWGV